MIIKSTNIQVKICTDKSFSHIQKIPHIQVIVKYEPFRDVINHKMVYYLEMLLNLLLGAHFIFCGHSRNTTLTLNETLHLASIIIFQVLSYQTFIILFWEEIVFTFYFISLTLENTFTR